MHVYIGYTPIINNTVFPVSDVTTDIQTTVQVCQRLLADRWFSPGTPISSTNKTDRHDIAKILFKVVLNTITLKPKLFCCFGSL
jgi:hypothetical protein